MLSKGCPRYSTSAPTLSQSAVLAFFRPLLRTGLFWFCTHRVAYLRHWRPISRIRLIEDRIPVDRFVLQFLKQKRAVKALVIGRRFYTAPFCADRFTWNSLPLSLSPILAFPPIECQYFYCALYCINSHKKRASEEAPDYFCFQYFDVPSVLHNAQ